MSNKTRYEDLFSSASVVALNAKLPPNRPAPKVRKKVRRASRVEVQQIDTLLRDYLVKKDELTWEYTGDMSDDKIAKFINTELNQDHVALVRRQLYGNLYHPPMPSNNKHTELLYKVAMLETRLARLERFLSDGLDYKP